MKMTLLRTAFPAVILLSVVALMTGCNQSYGHRVVSAGENELTISDNEGVDQKTHEVAPDAKITLDGQLAKLDQLDAGDPVTVKTEERDGKEVATEIKAKTKQSIEAEKTAPALPDEQPIRSREDMPRPSPAVTPQADVAPPTTLPKADAPPNNPDGGTPPLEDADDLRAEEKVNGTLSSIGTVDNEFVIADDNGEEHTFTVNDDTKYMRDGKEATFGDLKVGHFVKVTAKRDGDSLVATLVDVTTR